MKTAQGRILDDYTYEYTCANCNGAGFFANDECTYCYNRDYKRCMEAFRNARGQRYYALLKTILSLKGKNMVEDVLAIKAGGKLASIADLIHLMAKYEFPPNRFKPFCEWLEECRAIKSGAYTRIIESRWTIRGLLDQLGYEDYR